jgi:hypothetical protein
MPQPTDSIKTRFDAFVVRLINSGVASPTELVGCSDDEIERLERKYEVRLPTSYRLFLQVMGHKSGRLFTHDHVSTSYSEVLGLTEKQIQFWQETPESERVMLPADALVILNRLGEQWLCIRCTGSDDAVVLYYSEWETTMKESHPSVLEWLETWRAEAEEAIASGYYKLGHRN